MGTPRRLWYGFSRGAGPSGIPHDGGLYERQDGADRQPLMVPEDDDPQGRRLPARPDAGAPRAAPGTQHELAAERLRITLASIGDAVISTDADGRVTYLNPVAETLTGWSAADAAGRPLPEVFRILHEHTREPAVNPALQALREGRVVGLANHTLLIARDGTERPIDDSAAPMLDGSGTPVGAVLVFRDMTERRRNEEARARLAAIVESSDDAIISKTLDGVIRTWNTGAERVFGYQAEEVVGRHITLLIPPERIPEEEEQQILARLSRGELVDHYETVRMSKDGRRLDISLTVSPIRDPEGRIIGASKVARDVTERKRVEAALQEAAEALKEADRRKDEFLAVLAHELRNPLAPLRNGLQVMRLRADDPELVARTREMMDRQLSHMVRLIDDLLDVSRISRNKMELRRSRVLLADVVGSAVETARPALEAAGHELTVALPPEPVLLDADLTRLAQVFGNLLTTAPSTPAAEGTSRSPRPARGTRSASASATTGSASPPPPCRPSSRCSARWTARSSAAPVGWGSGWRSSRGSSRCTAGPSRRRAPARTRAARSPSPCRWRRNRRSPRSPRRPRRLRAPRSRGGASWSSTTAGTRRPRWR